MKVRLRLALRYRAALLALSIAVSGPACKRSRAPVEEEPAASSALAEQTATTLTTAATSPAPGTMPAGLENPVPLRAEVVTRKAGGKSTVTLKRTITRGKDRVHVARAPEDPKTPGSEWLFVQNPDDVRRVSGTLVEHEIRSIVVYREHELASAGMSRHWVEVATFGLKVGEAFETLRPTGKREQAFGFEFIELAAQAEHEARFRSLWWSDRAAAPLRWVTEDARGRTEVSATFGTDIDAGVLRDPRERFPEYEVTDLEGLQPKPSSEETILPAASAPASASAPAENAVPVPSR